MEETTENLNSSIEETSETPTETQKDEYTEREKQYYARIKDLEKKLKEVPKEAPLSAPEPKLSVDQKVDLRLEGYSKEEIAYIERNLHDRTLEDTLADPHVKAGIEGVRQTTKAQEATPAPSTAVPTFTAEKKTWAQMSEQERRDHYQTAISKIQANGRRVE